MLSRSNTSRPLSHYCVTKWLTLRSAVVVRCTSFQKMYPGTTCLAQNRLKSWMAAALQRQTTCGVQVFLSSVSGKIKRTQARKQFLLTCYHGQMKIPTNQLEGSTYFATPRVADKTISLNKPTERRLMGTYETDKDQNMLDYLLIPLKDEATRCPSIYRKCPVRQINYQLFQGDYRSLTGQMVYKYGHKTKRTTGVIVKMPRKVTSIEDYDEYGNPDTQRKVWKVEIKPEGDEAFAKVGDSGSPVGFERDGKVVVLGLIWRKGADNKVLISPITAAMKNVEEQYNYTMEPVDEATN